MAMILLTQGAMSSRITNHLEFYFLNHYPPYHGIQSPIVQTVSDDGLCWGK